MMTPATHSHSVELSHCLLLLEIFFFFSVLQSALEFLPHGVAYMARCSLRALIGGEGEMHFAMMLVVYLYRIVSIVMK